MLLSKTNPGWHAQPGLQVSSLHLSISGSARSVHVLVQEQLLHTQPEGPGEGLKYYVNCKMPLKNKNTSVFPAILEASSVISKMDGETDKAVTHLQVM